MRWWLILSALILASNPVSARIWHCDGALSTDDKVLGVSDTKFRIHMTEAGRFSADRPTNRDSDPQWLWDGHWADVDGQLAMIGIARTRWRDPILHGKSMQTEELRAYSALVEADVLVLNLSQDDGFVLVRCLRQAL